MDIRPLTPAFAVSPQIDAADMPAIAAAGFTCILDNRPNGEVGPDQAAEAIRQAAQEAGITFVYNPIENGAMTSDNVAAQGKAASEAAGPVLAYCRSGTRSSMAWLMANAAQTPADDLLRATAAAGYQLDMLKPQMDQIFEG